MKTAVRKFTTTSSTDRFVYLEIDDTLIVLERKDGNWSLKKIEDYFYGTFIPEENNDQD
jgi:hypothetical protein